MPGELVIETFDIKTAQLLLCNDCNKCNEIPIKFINCDNIENRIIMNNMIDDYYLVIDNNDENRKMLKQLQDNHPECRIIIRKINSEEDKEIEDKEIEDKILEYSCICGRTFKTENGFRTHKRYCKKEE